MRCKHCGAEGDYESVSDKAIEFPCRTLKYSDGTIDRSKQCYEAQIRQLENSRELVIERTKGLADIYREAHPRDEFYIPDLGDMCNWAVSELTTLRQQNEKMEKALRAFIKFAEIDGDTVTRDQYIGYQVNAIGLAEDIIHAIDEVRKEAR